MPLIYSTRLEGNTFQFRQARLKNEKGKQTKYEDLTIEILGGHWEIDPINPISHRLVISRGEINGKNASECIVVTSETMPTILGGRKSSPPRAEKKRIAIGGVEVTYGPDMYGVIQDNQQLLWCEWPILKIENAYLEVLPMHHPLVPPGCRPPVVSRAFRFTNLKGILSSKNKSGSARRVNAKELLIFSVQEPRFSFVS